VCNVVEQFDEPFGEVLLLLNLLTSSFFPSLKLGFRRSISLLYKKDRLGRARDRSTANVPRSEAAVLPLSHVIVHTVHVCFTDAGLLVFTGII
jgi:hypothetical protein